MERIVLKSECGSIAVNDIIVYSSNENFIGAKASNYKLLGWRRIKPNYYKWLDDDAIVEIWHDRLGIVVDSGHSKLREGLIKDDWVIGPKYVIDITEEYKNENLDNIDKVTMELEEETKINDSNANICCERKFPFWLKVIAGHDRPIGTIFYVKDNLTLYREQDVEIYTGYIPSFTENDILFKMKPDIKSSKANLCCEISCEEAKTITNAVTAGLDYSKDDSVDAMAFVFPYIKRPKQNNNGGASKITPDYYGAKCKCGEKIDAYTICDKYSNKNKGSAWHHAVKKLIRAGDGHKPLLKDIDEVIDSLNRWKEQLIDKQAIEKDENDI